MKFKNWKNKLKILSIFGILSATVVITTPILLNKNPIISTNSNNQANYINNDADQSLYNSFEINAETNFSLFSEVFPNDKGFGGDWLNAVEANDQAFINQKLANLQTYLNNNKTKVLKNPNDNMTILIEEFGNATSTNTWNVIWKVNETVDGVVNTLDPSPAFIEINFKQTPTNSSPVVINLSKYISEKVKALSQTEIDSLTVNQVKQWIADYFNQNKAELPKDFFPTSGTFTLNDLSAYDDKINITKTGVSIAKVQVGSGWSKITILPINEITFTQPSDNTNNKPVDKNYDGDNWQPYVIFGTSGAFLIILAILIIFYIRKRSKNKKAAVGD